MTDNNNQFSETVDNVQQQGAEYDVFSENSKENRINAEMMNRDYLNHIYDEDMDFLNKEIRMTRSQYNCEIAKIEEFYKNEKKQNIKQFVLITVLFVILLMVALFFFGLWFVNTGFYTRMYAGTRFGTLFVPPEQLRGLWAFAGFFGCIAWILFFFDISIFAYFTFGFLKNNKKIKANKKKAIETIEMRKYDFMMLGQYDASR